MFHLSDKKTKDTNHPQTVTDEEIRLDSPYAQEPVSKDLFYSVITYIAAFAAGAVILIGLYYEDMLVSILKSAILPYLSMLDDSSGFLTDMTGAVLHLLFFVIIAVFFGFALDMNFSVHGRPKEIWAKYIPYILSAAFASCALYIAVHHLATGKTFHLTGSPLSQGLYYLNMIVIVPAANVLLYLVLPAAIIRMLLTVVSDTRDRAELPLMIVGALVMTLAQLGITPKNIVNYGFGVTAFALIQSALCSVLYRRTNTIWRVILLYSGVSAMYLALAAMIHSFI